MRKILKIIKQNMPALTAGIFCWLFLSFLSGTSCWVRSISGFPCPGCGLTRAAAALFSGDIKKAFNYHPLIIVAIAFILVCIAAFIFNINILKTRARILLWCVFVLFTGVYIARMILFYPDTEPMTYLDTSLWGRFINFLKYIRVHF